MAELSERFFSPTGNSIITYLEWHSSADVKEWLRSYLIPYFLSDNFADSASLTLVRNREQIPEKFRNSEKPVYAVTPSQSILNKWILIVQYLNRQQLVGQDKYLPTSIDAIENEYYRYVVSLKDKEQTKLIAEYGDGFKWVELQDRAAVERESALMLHCAASDDTPHYIDLIHGHYKFLSLRENNEPRITMKYCVATNVITDLIGRQNTFPDKKYDRHVVNIINKLKLLPAETVLVPFNRIKYNEETERWELV